jgi:hypothetical protein
MGAEQLLGRPLGPHWLHGWTDTAMIATIILLGAPAHGRGRLRLGLELFFSSGDRACTKTCMKTPVFKPISGQK